MQFLWLIPSRKQIDDLQIQMKEQMAVSDAKEAEKERLSSLPSTSADDEETSLLKSGAPLYEKSDDLQHIAEANEEDEDEDWFETSAKGKSLDDQESTEPSTARRSNSADSRSNGQDSSLMTRLLTEDAEE